LRLEKKHLFPEVILLMDIQSGDIEISLNDLDDYKKHGDMYPIPEGVVPIEVCHARGSTTNP